MSVSFRGVHYRFSYMRPLLTSQGGWIELVACDTRANDLNHSCIRAPPSHNTYVWFFMALKTTLVLCARSQDSVLSVSVRMVLVVISTLTEFKGGGKSRPKTHETVALRRGIQKVSRT